MRKNRGVKNMEKYIIHFNVSFSFHNNTLKYLFAKSNKYIKVQFFLERFQNYSCKKIYKNSSLEQTQGNENTVVQELYLLKHICVHIFLRSHFNTWKI